MLLAVTGRMCAQQIDPALTAAVVALDGHAMTDLSDFLFFCSHFFLLGENQFSYSESIKNFR